MIIDENKMKAPMSRNSRAWLAQMHAVLQDVLEDQEPLTALAYWQLAKELERIVETNIFSAKPVEIRVRQYVDRLRVFMPPNEPN
jgi:hypothetical protein